MGETETKIKFLWRCHLKAVDEKFTPETNEEIVIEAGKSYWRGRLSTAGDTKGENITVLLTSCLTGLDKSVLQIKKIASAIQLIQNQLTVQWYFPF